MCYTSQILHQRYYGAVIQTINDLGKYSKDYCFQEITFNFNIKGLHQ